MKVGRRAQGGGRAEGEGGRVMVADSASSRGQAVAFFCTAWTSRRLIPLQIRRAAPGIAVAILTAVANRQDLNARAFRLTAFLFKLYPRVSACGTGHAHVMNQLLRAASSIGSNLEEGTAPSSRRDMAAKYEIALRESREANFWARLLATDPKMGE